MRENKRGVVMLIQAGDPEICEPIKAGILAGREKAKEDLIRPASRATIPTGERLLEGETAGERPDEARGAVAAGADRRELAKLVRVAVGNTKTAEDYMILRAAAAQEYRVRSAGGPVGRLAEALLGAYALAVYQVNRFFAWEESRWREG